MKSKKEEEKRRVFVIDDDEDVRWSLNKMLKEADLDVVLFPNGETALKELESDIPDVVLLDQNIEGFDDGLTILQKIRHVFKTLPVIFLTGHGDIRHAIEATRMGASDYLLKPCDKEELMLTIERVLERRDLLVEVKELRRKLAGRDDLEQKMGSSAEIKKIHNDIVRIAPTSFSVLIQGESGVGKELVAKGIHDMSPRSENAFVAVDCGAIPPTLIESELFGHEKGAFTGADKLKEGLFEAANGGTLFLDEIGNLDIDIQVKLLRALQEKKIKRVGSSKTIDVDVRVITSTNVLLAEASQKGTFRPDLFYRINEFTILIPPLRERKDDILYLATRFMQETNEQLKKNVTRIDREAVRTLVNHSWIGNVRELQNITKRAVLLAEDVITVDCLMFDLTEKVESRVEGVLGALLRGRTLREIKAIVEREAIEQALNEAGGNKSEVSRKLDIDYKNLLAKIKEYKIDAWEIKKNSQ